MSWSHERRQILVLPPLVGFLLSAGTSLPPPLEFYLHAETIAVRMFHFYQAHVYVKDLKMRQKSQHLSTVFSL